jgi:hypothetical protein
MVITLEQFKEELDRNWSEYTRTRYEQAPEEYSQIARVETTDRFFDKLGGVQGISGPVENRDSQAIPFFSPIKNYTTFIVQKFYRGGYSVTRDLLEMGQYDVAIDNLDDMIRSEKTLRDKTAVDVINNGTSVQGYEPVEADGTRRALFSTGHVREDNGATISNYYNVLVPPNLDTVYEIGMNYLNRLTDNVGNFIGGYGELTIITPTSNPAYVKAADVIVASMEDPSTANRSVNTARTRFKLKHISLNQLTNSNYWYVRVDISLPSYPIRLKTFKQPEVSALQMMANNPDAMFSRMRSVFGVGLGPTFRGIVAVGA